MLAVMEKIKEIALGIILFIVFMVILCLMWAIIKSIYLKLVKNELFFSNVKKIFLNGTVSVILEAVNPFNWL